MAIARGVRIALIATLLVGWCWSPWVIVLSILAVYIPNPWISGDLMNSVSFALFLFSLVIGRALFRQETTVFVARRMKVTDRLWPKAAVEITKFMRFECPLYTLKRPLGC